MAYHLAYQCHGITNPMLIEIDDNPFERYIEIIAIDENGHTEPYDFDDLVEQGHDFRYAHGYYILGPPGYDDSPIREDWRNVWKPFTGSPLLFREITCEHLGNILRFCLRNTPTYAKHLTSRHFDKITWPRRREVLKSIYKEFKRRLRKYLP